MSCAQAGTEHSRTNIKRLIVDLIFLSRQFLSYLKPTTWGPRYSISQNTNYKTQQGVLSARFAILQIGEQ